MTLKLGGVFPSFPPFRGLPMRILFIGYWGFTDPLTVATIMPNLELLHQLDHVEHLVLATIERKATEDATG